MHRAIDAAHECDRFQRAKSFAKDNLNGISPLCINSCVCIHSVADCATEDSPMPEVRCHSDPSVCLVDFMFCDGIKDCPMGEDEDMSLCVMRLWVWTVVVSIIM